MDIEQVNRENAIDDFGANRTKTRSNINSFYIYLRSQFTALLATLGDFSVTIFLKEIIGFWYVHAVGVGAAIGALIAFVLNRNWVFKSNTKSVQVQIFRYGLVAGGSWVLNTGAVYLMTELCTISYLYSKVAVSIFIGLSYNYILAKRFVFV